MKGILLVIALATLPIAACNKASPESKITVKSASYGLNCNADNIGNYTSKVGRECDQKSGCTYAGVGSAGDVCNGVGKEFTVTWTCSGVSAPKTLTLPTEASSGPPANLTCP